jgi:hypothetical protein
VQKIDVPGLGSVEFPDGMSAADMSAAIRRTLAANAPKQSGADVLASQTGPLESMLVGAGRTTDKVVQGVRQLYNKATGDQQTLDQMAADEAEKDAAYGPLAKSRPWSTGFGEAVPMMAVPTGGGAGLGLIAKSAMAGALPGALSYGDTQDRLKSAGSGALGGAVGGAMSLGLARLLKPAGAGVATISPEAQSAAERLGYQLSPAQISQNPAMGAFENYLARSPGSSGAMQAKALANQAALNKAAAGAMGQQSDTLGEGVFNAAKTGIGNEYRRLEGLTNPVLGNNFLSTLTAADTANAAKGSFRNSAIDSVIDKGLDLAQQGSLTGTAYKEIRSELASQAYSAGKSGDAPLKEALKSIVGSLDDAAKASLPQEEQQAWDTARRQWNAYKLLSKSNVSEGGNVSAARLAAALRQQGDALRTGTSQGPLADIARLGEAVKSVPNPTSGQLAQQMVYGNPVTGIPMLLGNKMTGALYNNPMVQKYLAQGLIDIGPGGQIVLGKVSLPVGSELSQSYFGTK